MLTCAVGCTNVRCVLPEHTSADLGPVTRMLDEGTLYLRSGEAFLVDGVRVTVDSVLGGGDFSRSTTYRRGES